MDATQALELVRGARPHRVDWGTNPAGQHYVFATLDHDSALPLVERLRANDVDVEWYPNGRGGAYNVDLFF